MPAQNRERIDKERTYYHVYNKGVESRILFSDEEDYQVFIGYLEDYLTSPKDPNTIKKVFEIKGRTFKGTPHQPKNYFGKLELVAYSLKSDHFHLLLHQLEQGSQEKFIRSLCTRYSMYFNKKHERSGSLFEGPYKSIPIDKERLLTYLTYIFHKASHHSSYAVYLGTRKTSWIKPQSVLDFFKSNIDSYKYFIEKNGLTQEEKELIGNVAFANDVQCMERRDLASSKEIDKSSTKISRPRAFGFFATSFMAFLLLLGLGFRNMYIHGYTQITPISQVLPAKTEVPALESTSSVGDGKQMESEITPEPRSETGATQAAGMIKQAKALSIATVYLDDPSLNINIREQPSTDSAKIGKARSGDTFKIVSENEEWYEVKLSDGQVGYISAKYIITNQEQQ